MLPSLLRASLSVIPTEAIGGWLNTALGMQLWSTATGSPLPNTVSAKACPSRIATGVSWTRSVTSPTA